MNQPGMNFSRMKYLSAMMLIGDGVTALVRPHRDARAWHTGPGAWQHLMRYLDERPALTRMIGAVEIAAAVLWLARKQPAMSKIMEDLPLDRVA